jgi:hypothetical protein
MTARFPFLRRMLLAAACVATLRADELASDTRSIRCAKPCRLELGQVAKGTIGVKLTPYAQKYLAKLYEPKDSFSLQAGKLYYLDLIESPKEGYFSFELQLVPVDGGSPAVFAVRSEAKEPFISITRMGDAGAEADGHYVISTDRNTPLISFQ